MGEIRNVLLVTVDCLRADRFREGIESGFCPTFAELEEAGTTFESTFTVSNTTDPSLLEFGECGTEARLDALAKPVGP